GRKGLGIATFARKAAKPEERAKGLLVEPVLASLAGEHTERIQLPGDVIRLHWNVEVGLTEIAIPFRYFIFPDLMRPERVPGQLVDQAMILMSVVARMSQNEIRIGRLQELFKELLDEIGRASCRERV